MVANQQRILIAVVVAVAVFGERVGILFDDGTRRTAHPDGVAGMRRIADGSLMAPVTDRKGVWLGTRAGRDFAWAHVTVEPM